MYTRKGLHAPGSLVLPSSVPESYGYLQTYRLTDCGRTARARSQTFCSPPLRGLIALTRSYYIIPTLLIFINLISLGGACVAFTSRNTAPPRDSPGVSTLARGSAVGPSPTLATSWKKYFITNISRILGRVLWKKYCHAVECRKLNWATSRQICKFYRNVWNACVNFRCYRLNVEWCSILFNDIDRIN